MATIAKDYDYHEIEYNEHQRMRTRQMKDETSQSMDHKSSAKQDATIWDYLQTEKR